MIYASKYYDPVKAHAYYESHKHLKGRHSTRGMDEHQKQMAAYIKNKLNANKSADIHKAAVISQKRAGENRKRLSDSCAARIDSLKKLLRGLPEEQRADAKALIEYRIRSLRSEYSRRKKQVTRRYYASLDNEKNNIRKNYDNKYTAALTMLRGKQQ